MTGQTLAVTLPANTLYVTGTVNNIVTVWTRASNQMWETTAARASNDIYDVTLLVYDNAGGIKQASVRLYYGLQLITDRTQTDVDTAAVQNVFNRDLKGAYNASDLNRVGFAMRYVADRMLAHGYGVDINPKTDWTRVDAPVQSQMKYYLDCLRHLRAQFAVYETTPQVPDDMDLLTYIEANNIEKILQDLDTILTFSELNQIYSGEVFAGEV